MKRALPLLPLFFLGAAVAGLSAVAACTTSTTAASGMPPCAVQTTLTNRCQTCHSDPPKFGAPMPLVTRADLLAKSTRDGSKTYAERAVVRMRDPQSPMPQAPNPRAPESEIAAFESWIAAGTPENTAQCAVPPTDASAPLPEDKLACPPDVTLKPPTPFEMPQDVEDEYVCYGVDLPGTAQKRHVIGLDAKIDNASIVHHILVFESPTTESGTPHKCKDIFPLDWKLIYAWAPGTKPYNLPAEAGYPLDPGTTTHYVVQLHYSNIKKVAGQKDSTGVSLCTTTDLRKNDADLIAVGGASFSLPPKAKTTIECSLKIPQNPDKFPITVFRGWPHMHQLGASLSTKVLRPDGSSASLGEIAQWDFYNQIGYPMNVKVASGDTVVTRCTWNNTTNERVGFGERTGDEMCYNFVTYYPKTNLQAFSGVLPASISQCKVVP
ncbi:MAG: peptidylglycine alpha-amidating monooxygenase [Myxococcales bacterium]|nr:peptidylglycine alpha-amidating monooxygenase [Myxococcales bacterium]HQY60523.1 peptidylglycine alpha-amidating monooxygenase [Polyangiaceae bacterium]